MSIMNSKERKARDRGRKQGYQMCLDELRDYFMLGQAQVDNPDLKKQDVIKVLQHLEKMEKKINSHERVILRQKRKVKKVNNMSMRSSFIYGYGFNCDCDEEKLIDFVKAHKETFCKSEEEIELYNEMLNYTSNEYDLENFFDRYSCESSRMEGNGAVIANIMSRETGIRFMYCQPDGDCDTYASVVFAEGYPWQLNEVEKNLTEEKLADICKKYMDELGIEDAPDCLNLEYYG